MRTLRLLLAVAFISVLFGGLAGGVGAQGAADPLAPAIFTFTTEPVGDSFMPERTVVRGHEVRQKVEATDPRASGLLAVKLNSNLVGWSEGAVMTAVMSQRLVNAGGAWSGTGRFVMAGAGDGGMMASMDVLTGEGGYEGLTLVMGQSTGAGPMSNWGVIVPSDQVPPLPDPLPAE